ncbi:MAG: hypothetical protein WD595_04790 [Waddliaceae bacterium]
MLFQDDYVHAKFGIDEIYLHEKISSNLLHKLHQRAIFSVDTESATVQKYASHDMILVFYKQNPTQSLVYRLLKFLDQYEKKQEFINFNIIEDESELFATVKSKKYVLITYQTLSKESYIPN